MTRILSALAAAGVLALAGCGSSNNSSSSSSSDTGAAASTPAASTGSSGGGAVTIHLKNIAFDPKATTVKVGTTVKWVNDDSVDHNVTATNGDSFKSSSFGQGKSYEHKVTKAGSITYVCTLHPGMSATLTVTP